MELALYCPVHGYYETKTDNPGRWGDFYTSVGVGELFGQLLAFQFAEWLESMRTANGGLRILEAGAHDGKLAGDMLAWLRLNRRGLFEQIEYWIVEPSLRRQEWQKKKLEQYSSQVRWFTSFQSITENHPQLTGIIFSNELLDAMPVRRFGWDAANKCWFEWGVAIAGDEFIWARMPTAVPASDFSLPVSPELLEVLPDGYVVETCPAAENWWRQAAKILKSGKLLTIDYGFTADELFSPVRTHGSLRAYYRHHATDDLFANVGKQDLTAHVNFSAIEGVGKSAGLKTEIFQTQAQFLTRILGNALHDKYFGNWTTAQGRQFQTLTHPEHLGRAFRVLAQSC